ncbi:MAG TPA: hypothetical protein VFD46_07045, partial [Chryseolinea sp.]|nr:hypothetical protein [Chryseolinea sp.]
LRYNVPVNSWSNNYNDDQTVGTQCLSYAFFRDIITGGDVCVCLSTVDGLYRYEIRKGTTLSNVIIRYIENGSQVYSQTVNIVDALSKGPEGLRFLIKNETGNLSFWRQDFRFWDNITVSGNGISTAYVNASDIPDTDLYMSIRAANVSGSAYVVRINDMAVHAYDNVTMIPFRLGDKAAEAHQLAISGGTISSENSQWLLETFQDLEDEGLLFGIQDVLGLWLDAPNALVSLLGKKTMTITGTVVKTATGYDFQGGIIDTGIDLSTLRYMQPSTGFAYIPIERIDTQTSTRLYCQSFDGSNVFRIYTNGTNRLVTLNKGTAANRTVAGLYNTGQRNRVSGVRFGGTGTSENLWINGVVQTATSGGNSAAVPTGANLILGAASDGSSPIDAELGVIVFIGNGLGLKNTPAITSGFDHQMLDTIAEELRAKIIA